MARYPGRKPVSYDKGLGRGVLDMQRGSSPGLRKLLRSLAKKKAKSEELLREYVHRLASAYPHAMVVLFGSRARGDHLPYSDYDIALVLPDEECQDRLEETLRARRLKPRGISVDLVIICDSELEDPLIKQMLSSSKVLYKPSQAR